MLLDLVLGYTSGVFQAVLEISIGMCIKNLILNCKASGKQHAQLVEQCEALKKGHEESDEREAALADLKAIQLKHNELKSELEKSASMA
ncbi:hypothetical protein P8452_38189 [Trifolium repens]|nr:hypothetical protein P8452_10405 [Trifolium repens]WJX52041.1 hypothetical protein P8452_38189 [Trifolium repens]